MRTPGVRVMVMTLHKLTAGDGYLYLVRQVAAADSTERGRSTLADYYSAKGETPGRWMGRGLAALSDTGRCEVNAQVREEIWTVEAGSGVSEAQMRALYGEGLHPNAERIETYVAGRNMGTQQARPATLGRKFLVRDGEPEFARRLAVAFRDHNAEVGAHWNATIAPEIRADIRTRVAMELFGEEYGRPPADDRELSGFIARNTRAPHHRRRRLRPDVLTGEIGVGAVGHRPADQWPSRSKPPTTRRWPTSWSGCRIKPPSPAPAPTVSPKSTPKGSSPRCSPTAIPAPAIPTCTPMWRSPTRCPMSTPTGCAAGWPWTVNRCTESRSRPRSCTTPDWKPT